MTLVRGDRLPAEARAQVLGAFVYRWTRDNPQRESAWGPCPSCDIANPAVASSAHGHRHPTIPLVSDKEWLASHAFHVTKAGKLHAGRRYAEPAFLAEGDE